SSCWTRRRRNRVRWCASIGCHWQDCGSLVLQRIAATKPPPQRSATARVKLSH
ncbi:unnamed protein product, partial [Ectocarpus sp. 12 AP-2014]